MKRFLVFAGDMYYPDGGWNDFRGAYDTLKEAKARVDEIKHNEETCSGYDWAHIADTATGEILEEEGVIHGA
jgi:hypothetical protein